MREININNIANSVKQGKVSFLVGAGISYNSGIPLVGNINDDLKIVIYKDITIGKENSEIYYENYALSPTFSNNLLLYSFLLGITALIPPLGFSTSPLYLGIRCMCT